MAITEMIQDMKLMCEFTILNGEQWAFWILVISNIKAFRELILNQLYVQLLM